MSTPVGIAFCHSCSGETKYRCLVCQIPTCNRSTNCSIAVPEDSPDWRACLTVAICASCKRSKEAVGSKAEDIAQLKRGEIESRANQIGCGSQSNPKVKPIASKLQKKRKCLSLQQRLEVVRYPKDKPDCGYRKIAEHFGIGRTQAQKIL